MVTLKEMFICCFNNSALEKCTNGKAFCMMATAQFWDVVWDGEVLG